MAKRAVLYARVSTEEQAKGYSLQTQLDAGRKYAAEKGYTVAAEFKDDYTGASLDRPGLNRLREFVAPPRENGGQAGVGVVIVYDVDRLARKSVYQMLIEDELSKQGATVEYVNGQYADTDEGRLQKQIKASIAEYEKAKILERSKRGKKGKAQSGFVVVAARPPYGYRVKKEPHKSWLVIDDEEAQIVRLVFECYLFGDGQSGPLSIGGIALRLTELHVPTRGDRQKHFAKKRGPGVWSGGMIGHILSNETYTGVWHYGKTQMVSDPRANGGGGKQLARPREEWVAVDVPAIIDRAALDAAQKRMALNREQARRNGRREYLLGRRLKCARCGYTYVGRTRREKNQYYYCKGHEQRPVSLCDMPNFRADLADATVWEWLKDIMQQPDKLAVGLQAEQAESERANSAIRERLALIGTRLADTHSQLGKVLDLYLQGDFPKEVLTERKARLEKDAADLTHERAEIAAHLETAVITDERIAEIKTFCAEVREGLENATFEDKRYYFDRLGVYGRLAVENGEKVVYAQCKIEKQRLSVVPTLPLSSNQNGNDFEIVITARLVIERLRAGQASGALAGALFAGAGVPVGAR